MYTHYITRSKAAAKTFGRNNSSVGWLYHCLGGLVTVAGLPAVVRAGVARLCWCLMCVVGGRGYRCWLRDTHMPYIKAYIKWQTICVARKLKSAEPVRLQAGRRAGRGAAGVERRSEVRWHDALQAVPAGWQQRLLLVCLPVCYCCRQTGCLCRLPFPSLPPSLLLSLALPLNMAECQNFGKVFKLKFQLRKWICVPKVY